MQLNIKDAEAIALVDELVRHTHESKTEAIKVAVRERLERQRTERERRVAEILELAREIRANLTGPPMSIEDLYDPETGLPR